jgi:polysaccharide export outer membrane protein
MRSVVAAWCVTVMPSVLCAVPADSAFSADSAAAKSLIEPGDVLEIVILGEEELSRTQMVMHTGNISFPLVGDVHVAGLTTTEVTTLLARHLKAYFVQPVISVILKSPSTPHVSVFGSVIKPGTVEYQRGLRVTDYLAQAGGPAAKANLRKVKVVRFSAGRSSIEILDVSAILSEGRTDGNHVLKAGDWLFVPERLTITWSAVIQLATLAVTLGNLYIIVNRN